MDAVAHYGAVLSGGGLRNPGGCGPRRALSSQNPIPVQDRDSPGRLVLGFHVNDRSRTSRGAISETIEVAFNICIEFTCKSEFAEREALFKSELARVVSVFNQKVGDLANENILRQQSAMSDKII